VIVDDILKICLPTQEFKFILNDKIITDMKGYRAIRNNLVKRIIIDDDKIINLILSNERSEDNDE